MKRRGYAPAYERFAAMLREGRLAAGLTQEALATKLGRPQSFVAKYEAGERQLDVIEFILVTKAMGTSAAAIFQRLKEHVR